MGYCVIGALMDQSWDENAAVCAMRAVATGKTSLAGNHKLTPTGALYFKQKGKPSGSFDRCSNVAYRCPRAYNRLTMLLNTGTVPTSQRVTSRKRTEM